MNRSAAFDQSQPIDPKAAHDLIAKIAALLGVDEAHDHDAIESALDALFAAAGDRGSDDKADDGSSQLNASELRACKAQGCRPADFLRLKQMRDR